MFTTLGSFSAVYFTLAAVLFILILFEKHFIKLEDKIRAKKSSEGNASRTRTAAVKSAQRSKRENVKICRNTSAVRRPPYNAA